jgi:hypothetical protein
MPFQIKTLPPLWVFLLKALLLVGVITFISLKLKGRGQGWAFLVEAGTNVGSLNGLLLIGYVWILMPINWGIEALKWKTLVHAYRPISLGLAMKSVLSGLSLSFATPHGVGDYLGRIWQLEGVGRFRLTGALFFGRWSQFFITLTGGGLAIFALKYHQNAPHFSVLSPVGGWIVGIALAVFAILVRWVIQKQQWFRYLFGILFTYPLRTLMYVVGLSLIRYVVFSLQFFILLCMFDLGLPAYVMFAGVAWVFLVKSIVPSFNFLSDLGVREVSALLFFDWYGAPVEPVLTASFMLWFINLLVPTLVGLTLIPYLKWK